MQRPVADAMAAAPALRPLPAAVDAGALELF
jgi:hypothetical protein